MPPRGMKLNAFGDGEGDLYTVPDSIEPLIGYRAWNIADGKLFSLNDWYLWPPGEKAVAGCNNDAFKSSRWAWMLREEIAPGDLTAGDWYDGMREFATEDLNRWASERFGINQGHLPAGAQVAIPRPPNIILPYGQYVYSLVIERHDPPPAEECSCGLYAVSDPVSSPGGPVYGEIKAWGRVIPGSRGFRAQYAYPTKLVLSNVDTGAADVRELGTLLAKNYKVPVAVGADADDVRAILSGQPRRARGNELSW